MIRTSGASWALSSPVAVWTVKSGPVPSSLSRVGEPCLSRGLQEDAMAPLRGPGPCWAVPSSLNGGCGVEQLLEAYFVLNSDLIGIHKSIDADIFMISHAHHLKFPRRQRSQACPSNPCPPKSSLAPGWVVEHWALQVDTSSGGSGPSLSTSLCLTHSPAALSGRTLCRMGSVTVKGSPSLFLLFPSSSQAFISSLHKH